MACYPSRLNFWRRFPGRMIPQRLRPYRFHAETASRGYAAVWWRVQLTPDDPLFEAGVENILVSSIVHESGADRTLEFARSALGEVGGLQVAQRWGCTPSESRARVRIVSSDARRALGLGANVRLIICDEPGAWSSGTGASIVGRHADKPWASEKPKFLSWEHSHPAPLHGPRELVAGACGGRIRRRAARCVIASGP